jgi:hypothetical protein
VAGHASILLIAVATAWDIAGTAASVQAWWHAASYVALAASAVLACGAVLLRTFERPRMPGETRRLAADLLAIGLLLLGWVLRGHHEVPPDPPLIGAQVLALGVLVLTTWRRRAAAITAQAAATAQKRFP